MSYYVIVILIMFSSVFVFAQNETQENILKLKDKVPDVRSSAAIVLGKTGDTQAVEPLIVCLKDSNSSVRYAAAIALVRIGSTQTIEPLIGYLKGLDSDERSYTIFALGKNGGKHATELFIGCLKGANRDLYASVIEVLQKIGDKQSVELLIWCLKDTELRYDAARALGYMRDKQAVGALIDCLRDSDGGVRSNAAQSLGMIGDKQAVEPLISCLKDPSGDVRSIAAGALSHIGDKRAIEPLVSSLADWEAGVSIRDALDAMQWKAKTPQETVHYLSVNLEPVQYRMIPSSVKEASKEALLKDWQSTKETLLTDAQSGNLTALMYAVNTFIKLGEESIIPELISILNTRGTKEMAEVYLNCGHRPLEEAAKSWAYRHGYDTKFTSGNVGQTSPWGGKKTEKDRLK